MNLSRKYIYPLFESVAIADGIIQHQKWHEERFFKSYQDWYGRNPDFDLFTDIKILENYRKGVVKLRISYNKEAKIIEYHNYKSSRIQTLKLVNGDQLNYSYKYQDRSGLNKLFEQKDTCDDILIVKNNLITDSSYANIVFYDGQSWFTPDEPLLKGTARARLLEVGIIKEARIKSEDLNKYHSFKLINALRDFKTVAENGVENIRF